jgi:hypothetical protein
LIGSYLLVPYLLVAKPEVSFETIGTLRMRSFDLELQSDKQCQEEIKDVSQALSVRLSGDEKRRLVYQICAKKERGQVQDDENLRTAIEDLDIFYGRGKNAKDTIFNRLFDGNVLTLFGEAMAAKRMATLVVNKQDLQNYQACVVQLSSNNEMFRAVNERLLTLKNVEADILYFWQEQEKLSKTLIGKLYFGKLFHSALNRNAAMLECLTRIGNCQLGFDLCGEFALQTITNYIESKLLHIYVSEIPALSIKNAMKSALEVYDPTRGINVIKMQNSPESYQVRDEFIKRWVNKPMPQDRLACWNDRLKKIGYGAGAYMSASSCWGIIAKVGQVRAYINEFAQRRDTSNFLQARLIGVSRYLRTLNELNELAKVYPCLAQSFPIAQVYDRIFNSESDKLKKLVEILMTDTFVGEPSFFSRTGRTLAAYTLMTDVKDELVECCQLLGDIDALLAVAKLYKTFEGCENATYSFAEYVESDRPYVKAVGFWNPLIDPRVAVTNSMELGGLGAARNMLLTGSNKGGKSTALKNALINALLAQTITIVPAKRYIATPFACLISYMNVTDDTAAGLSLFQSQVMRAKKLVTTVDSLAPELFAFIVIDEIFTGTGAEKAARAAYTIAEHLAQSGSVCFVLATHFVQELAKLEQNTNGLCKNFKIDAEKGADGQIIFRHKLEEGVSTQNIANEILNEEFETIEFGLEDGAALA